MVTVSAAEWAAVGLFIAVVLGLSLIDGELSFGLLLIIGIVVVVTTFNVTQSQTRVSTT